MIKFKVFEVGNRRDRAGELERLINEWARTLGPSTQIKRTQLAATDGHLIALINYDDAQASAGNP